MFISAFSTITKLWEWHMNIFGELFLGRSVGREKGKDAEE
jgi:hypothetical protein